MNVVDLQKENLHINIKYFNTYYVIAEILNIPFLYCMFKQYRLTQLLFIS